MNTCEDTALTYDDIILEPRYSEIESRNDIDLSTQLSLRYKLRIPIIASPMDTVCASDMAIAMAELGGVGCIHRFMTIEKQALEVRTTWNTVYDPEAYYAGISKLPHDRYTEFHNPIMAAIGANGDYLERAQELVRAGANVILIDVAHGHHKFVKIAISKLKQSLPSHVDVIAGNVATSMGTQDLQNWGADAVRVGIGGGSLCTTRIKTGFGLPNVTSIIDCVSISQIPIIADGGIRSSGDIAKALALGASTVMLGSLLAGTKETPGKIIEMGNGQLAKKYRGAASLETKSAHAQAERNVEGESTIVPFKGGVNFIVSGLMDGLRSALSYAGASSLIDFDPTVRRITSAGLREATPHLL